MTLVSVEIVRKPTDYPSLRAGRAGPPLAEPPSVDRGVIATATELFESRHYPSVVALLTEALDDEPDQVHLLLLRARAHIALRRDLDAQGDLRDIIRLDPQCSLAYRLLGELAARRDENESAAIFFREALRLDPGDREAQEWLAIVEISARPAAAAYKLPAPVAAAGRFPAGRSNSEPVSSKRAKQRPSTGFIDEPTTPRSEGDRRTAPFSRPRRLAAGSESGIVGEDGARLRHAASRPGVPELPGFGDYLVDQGILTRERLRAAQAYQRSMRVQLSTAIVTLGLATPQRIEWAAVAHQAALGSR